MKEEERELFISIFALLFQENFKRVHDSELLQKLAEVSNITPTQLEAATLSSNCYHGVEHVLDHPKLAPMLYWAIVSRINLKRPALANLLTEQLLELKDFGEQIDVLADALIVSLDEHYSKSERRLHNMYVIEVKWHDSRDLALQVQCVVCSQQFQEAYEILHTGTYICADCAYPVQEMDKVK